MDKIRRRISEKNSDQLPLCPVCGRELDKTRLTDKGGWNCKCGEFIPQTLVINPFEGCTHGLNCNCGRERKK